MRQTAKRSICKALTWKLLGITALTVFTYSMTGSLKAAGIVTAVYHVFMLIAYFFHEEMWNKIRGGRTEGLMIQLSGLSGAGKSTLSQRAKEILKSKGYQVEIIDGDVYREGISSDLGFSKEDRNTNIRRLSFIGSVLARNKVISIIAAINPYEDVRKEVQDKYPNSKLVYIQCSLDEVVNRDPKGLYEKALLPEGDPNRINNFTGISDPFERPLLPDLIINTEFASVDTSAQRLVNFILENV